MKNLLPILLLFVAFSGFSQKVKIKKGIATVDKVPYMQVDVTKKGLGRPLKATFKSLEGEPLVEYEYFMQDCNFGDNYIWHNFKFPGTETQMEIYYYDIGSRKKDLVKFFYKHELFTDGKLNPEALAKLKEQFPEPLAEQYKAKGEEEKEWIEKLKVLPERNTKATVRVDGNKIYQGNVLIGKWERFQSDRSISELIRILNADGIPAAVNQYDGMGKMKLKTGKDGFKHDMTKWVSPNPDWDKLARQIAVFMMKNEYL